MSPPSRTLPYLGARLRSCSLLWPALVRNSAIFYNFLTALSCGAIVGSVAVDACTARQVRVVSCCIRMVNAVASTWGTISVVVNNAGINRRRTMALSDVKVWRAIIETNLISSMLLSQLTLPHLIRHSLLSRANGTNTGAALVFINSTSGNHKQPVVPGTAPVRVRLTFGVGFIRRNGHVGFPSGNSRQSPPVRLFPSFLAFRAFVFLCSLLRVHAEVAPTVLLSCSLPPLPCIFLLATQYFTSKAGLHAFADSVFTEVRGFGVRVCTIAPGLVNTELGRKPGPTGRNFKAGTTKGVVMPPETMIQPEDLADAGACPSAVFMRVLQRGEGRG